MQDAGVGSILLSIVLGRSAQGRREGQRVGGWGLPPQLNVNSQVPEIHMFELRFLKFV